ncbi:NAD(P)H-binding protein [Dongia sp.]|uniref:NAD(P)H-binding protein n=1 Tax=Dongia sp. TaxID=1977262 RepID=UPI0037526C46
MTIGITGAGGQLGGSLLNELLARGAKPGEIVAVTRTPEKLAAFAAKGMAVRSGDFDAPAGLAAAFKGIDTLLIIPTSDLRPGIRTPQHKAAIKAAKEAGVKHLVYVSTVAARPGQDLMQSHLETEQAVFASGMKWTIARMGMYFENLFMGALQHALATGHFGATGPAPVANLARDDVAAALAGLLLGSGHEGSVYHLTGGASLTPAETAATVGQVFGKPVEAAIITDEQYAGGLKAAGLPDFVVEAILGIAQTAAKGMLDVVTGDVERLAGRKPVTLAAFLSARKQAVAA